jgi:hypothetical protein
VPFDSAPMPGEHRDMRTAGEQHSRLSMARAHALAASFLIGQAAQAVSSEQAAAPAKPPATLTQSSCTLPGLPQVARCGTLNVPENPERPAGRQLAIHFVVIPATDSATVPDPIVPLMGGPGEDTIGAAAIYAQQFSPLRSNCCWWTSGERGNRLRCIVSSIHTSTQRRVCVMYFPPLR